MFGLVFLRFGWIDEHFAVIPRIKALSNCGQSRTGLVPWRAPVTNKFDVFCFNQSGMYFFFNKDFLTMWQKIHDLLLFR